MVWNVQFDRDAHTINLPLLDDELRVQVKGIVGASTGPYGLIVHFESKPAQDVLETVKGIIEKHDPKQLTEEQQALLQWQADVDELSEKGWNDMTQEERDKSLRLQHEQMVFNATGKLPPTSEPKV